MGIPVCIYLFHQFLGIVLGCRRNLNLHLLFGIGIGFDVTVKSDSKSRMDWRK